MPAHSARTAARMPVSAAYLGIILIWSTTPLSIQWSTQGMSFAFALMARMGIGLVVALSLLILSRTRMPSHARARRAYLVGGLGLFTTMSLTYWCALYIDSGLISVMFGLSPLMASVLAAFALGEKSMTLWKIIGTLLGLAGLSVIFLGGLRFGGPMFIPGISILLLSVFSYTASLVWLKRIGDDSPPLATTVGTLSVSTPLFALLWLFSGGELPAAVPLRSGVAIVYLGVLGSAIAFTMY